MSYRAEKIEKFAETSSRLNDIDSDYERKREETIDSTVSKLINTINKKTSILAPLQMGKMAMSSSGVGATGQGLTSAHQKTLDQISTVNAKSQEAIDNLSGMTQALAPALAGLTAVTQLGRSNQNIDAMNKQSKLYEKTIEHLKNGSTFGSVAPGLAASTTKEAMRTSLGAGSLLGAYDLATTGAMSSTSTGLMSLGHPGMAAATMSGGMHGLGSNIMGLGGSGLNAVGKLTGVSGLSKVGSDMSTTAAGFDPATASMLSLEGALGFGGMMGIGIAANKMLNHVIDNSVLSKGKKNHQKWNLDNRFRRSSENPLAMQNYMSGLSGIKSALQMGVITAGEAQVLSTLEKIVFNTAAISEINDNLGDTERLKSNKNKMSMNQIDRETLQKDFSGTDTENLFNNGKLNKAQLAFLQTVSTLNSGLKSVNVLTNLVKSFKFQETDESYWALREAQQRNDPDSGIKEFAKKHDITLSDVNLLHSDLKSLIGNSPNPELAAAFYSTSYLQLIAQKSIGNKGGTGFIGELEKIKRDEEDRYLQNQDLIIDMIIKPMDKLLQKIPVIGAVMPAVHTIVDLAKGVSKLKDLPGNIGGFFGDMRKNVIDGMRDQRVKNETALRTELKTKALSHEELANIYISQELHKDLTKIQMLLGSNEEGTVQDVYTGEFITVQELKERRAKQQANMEEMLQEFDQDDNAFDMAKSWFKKKVFRINEKDLKDTAMESYDYLNKLKSEFDTSGLKGLDRPDQTNPFGIGTEKSESEFGPGSKSYSMMKFAMNTLGLKDDPLSKASGVGYYSMMEEYIPYLKEIKDCICECECDSKNPKNSSPSDQSNQEKLSKSKLKFPNTQNAKNTQDLLEIQKAKDQKNQFYEVFFKHIPYLEKLYNLNRKVVIKSGILKDVKKDTSSDSEDRGILGNIIDWMGFGEDADGRKNKKNKKNNKNRFGKTWRNVKTGVKDLAKTGWNSIKNFKPTGLLANAMRVGLAALSGLAAAPALAVAGKTALVGLAVGSVVGIMDNLFNDGKLTGKLWDSVKDTDMGRIMINTFDNVKTMFSNIKTWFTDLGTSIKDGIYGGLYKLTGLDIFKDGLSSSHPNSSASTQAEALQKTINKQKEDDLFNRLNSAKTPNEKFQIISSLKNDSGISNEAKQRAIDSIVQDEEKDHSSKFGYTLNWGNMQNTMGSIRKMDPSKQNEYIKEYDEYQTILRNFDKLNDVDKGAYEAINKMIAKIKEETRKDIESKSGVDKPKEHEELMKSLKTINEASMHTIDQVKNLIKESSSVNGVVLKSFSDQINVLSNSQGNIAGVLNATARLTQNPNKIVLDNNVLKLVPALG